MSALPFPGLYSFFACKVVECFVCRAWILELLLVSSRSLWLDTARVEFQSSNRRHCLRLVDHQIWQTFYFRHFLLEYCQWLNVLVFISRQCLCNTISLTCCCSVPLVNMPRALVYTDAPSTLKYSYLELKQLMIYFINLLVVDTSMVHCRCISVGLYVKWNCLYGGCQSHVAQWKKNSPSNGMNGQEMEIQLVVVVRSQKL